MKIHRISKFLVLALTIPAAALVAASTLEASTQLTANDADDSWSPNHSSMVGEKILFVNGLEQVFYHDGTTLIPVQDYVDGVPELDLVGDFVFGLGTGAASGQVIGAWRRGANYAWVYRSGQTPVQVDTFGANQFEPGQPTNPEWVSISDGCVFMIMQANVGGEIVAHVFDVDPSTGQVTSVSGADPVSGATQVHTSGCEAVWVWDPNDSGSGGALPTELQYWNGVTTATLDTGAISTGDLDFRDGKILYVKQVRGVEQVVMLDLDLPSPSPVVLSESLRSKVAPQTDGQQVAWGERTATNGVDVVLLGGLRVPLYTDERATRPGAYPFVLDSGQLMWLDESDTLTYLVDNELTRPDLAPAAEAKLPWLSDGWMAWVGSPVSPDDDEVFLHQGATPHDAALPAPPLGLEAEIGPGFATLRWSRVLGADSYNVYYAEEPGVDESNWAGLAGGTRVENATSPLELGSIDPTRRYYFVVSTVRDSVEGPVSGEAAPQAFVVDSLADNRDAMMGDGICLAIGGGCTLRAAITEASLAGEGHSVVVPAGYYLLDLFNGSEDENLGGDLDITGALKIVGAGSGLTVIHNPNERLFHVVDDTADFRVRMRGMTLDGGPQGILNQGLLELEEVDVQGMGSLTTFPVGAGIDSPGEWLELTDSQVLGNSTGSHAGGIATFMPDGGHATFRRTRFVGNTAGIGGGALYNAQADVLIVDSLFRQNHSDHMQDWPGGAIYQETGRLALTGSLFHANVSGDCGGGIYNGAGEVIAVNSTFAANVATTDGGAFCTEGYSDPPGTLKLSNLTLLDNVADNGSALELRGQSEVYLRNTAMQNGQNLTNCSGTGSVVDGGFNLDSGDDCNLGVTSLSLTDAMLGPLDDNGGPTETSLPLTGSPLVDGGDPLGCLDVFGDAVVVDQRAEPRPVDGDGADGPRCDIGAVESPLACLDVDGDGFPAQASPLCPGGESAPLDCDDADATVWATPGVVGELLLTDAQTLAWSAPVDPGATVSSLLYDVGVATVASGWVEGVNASCLASGVAGTMLTDSQAPQPGELVYYLVRATNGCPDGDGSWGVDSSGVVRSADVCE